MLDKSWGKSRLSSAAALTRSLSTRIRIGRATVDEKLAFDELLREFNNFRQTPIRDGVFTANVIGDHNLGDIGAFNNAMASMAGRPVAALMTRGGPATGFLVADDLLVTNHHVFPNAASATDAVARLNYERIDGELMPFKQYLIDPGIHYQSSVDVDAVVVGVQGSPGRDWGVVQLDHPGVPVAGRPAYVIQHPHGMVKKIGVRDNEIADVLADEVLYVSDTERGSSGAPVFDENFDIIALHKEGGHIASTGVDGTPYFANKGSRIEQVRDALDL